VLFRSLDVPVCKERVEPGVFGDFSCMSGEGLVCGLDPRLFQHVKRGLSPVELCVYNLVLHTGQVLALQGALSPTPKLGRRVGHLCVLGGGY